MTGSDPGWSDPPPNATPGGPLPPTRYRIDGRLGAGGMGEVFRAWDHHLQREVAWKRVRGGSAATADRLLGEARVTASLDHPSIVPILDVGSTAAGERFYTMRLVRGATLAAALPRLSRSQRLRHLLDVTHAVAHAHGRAVIHRDLKPENIMIGPDGETQVVDWGLACPADGAVDVGVGTARYLPAEGARRACTTDVYALGATLTAALAEKTGSWRESAASIDDPALRAIALRALAEAPEARYPTARELAADLEAYVDGGLVLAHDYAWWERGRLAARRWRWPLRVALAAAGAGVLVAAVAAGRVVIDRNRAIAAEQVAVSALSAADRVLAQSLTRQAIGAVAAGNRPEAEVLAASALAIADIPAARGARMAFAAQASPRLWPMDVGCRAGAFPDGWLCVEGGIVGIPGEPSFDAGSPEAVIRGATGVWIGQRYETWFVRGGVPTIVGHGPGALVVDGDRGARVEDTQVTLLDGASERLVTPCPGGRTLDRAAAWDPDGLWVVCRDGVAHRLDDGVSVRLDGVSEVHALAAVPGWLLVGAGEGRMEVYDRRTGARVSVLDPGVGRIRAITADARGDFALVRGASPGLAVMDLRAGARVLRLPGSWSDASVSRDGRIRVARPSPVELDPRGLVSNTVQVGVGLSHGALSPDGRSLALGLSDGTIGLWDVASGVRTLARTLVPARVTKWVAFSADGAEIWAANAGRGLPFRLSTADGAALPDPAASSDDKTCRRMLLFRGGLGACLTYGGFTPLVLGAVVPLEGSGVWVDAGQTGPDVGVILDEDGQVALIDAHGVRPVVTAPGASHVDVTADGRLIAVGFDDRIVLVDAAGRERQELRDPPSPGLDVALSPDGRWLAASGLSGEVRVWRVADGELRAVLSGVHAERVATVVFGADAVLTVGWDGRAHRWGLGPLESDEAAGVAEARWSLTLDHIVDHGP